MNKIPKDKGFKACMLLLAVIICAGMTGGCASSDDNINGHYEYEKTIYMNPASSYWVTKDNADAYIIADNSFTIVHFDGIKEQYSASFKKSDVDKEAFESMFQFNMSMPDISIFKNRYQYSINEVYRLYVMDEEVWIAQCPKNTMWGLYQISKIED